MSEPADTDIVSYRMINLDTNEVNCEGTMPYSAFKKIQNLQTPEGYVPEMTGVVPRPKRVDEEGGMVVFH